MSERAEKVLRDLKDEVGLDAIRKAYETLEKEHKEEMINERIEKAREEGRVFKSLDDYLQKEYGGKGKIETRSEGWGGFYYVLEENGEIVQEESLSIYMCGKCGVVKGRLESNPFNTIGQFGPLSGSAGRKYRCGICGEVYTSIEMCS